jgi:hypothetical protein
MFQSKRSLWPLALSDQMGSCRLHDGIRRALACPGGNRILRVAAGAMTRAPHEMSKPASERANELRMAGLEFGSSA